jgi:subtilisin family serine protease
MSTVTFFAPTLLRDIPQIASAQVQINEQLNWGAYAINATTAWSESTGSGVKIAVLDSGVGPINDVKVKEGYNCVNGNTDTTDQLGHGTMITSIIAATHSNSLGIWGIAPNAEIYPVKVMDDSGHIELKWAIAGVRWAINNHMQIISISWYISDNSNNDLKRVLDEAYYDNGILIVAAAGNNGKETLRVECPAAYDTTIAVAAVKQNLQRLETSAVGQEIELAAPGENIFAISPSNTIWSGSGTSFAVPYITGTAALIWEKNNTLTNKQVRDILCQTATDKSTPGRDTIYGYGIVNATAAIQMITGSNNNTPNNNTPNSFTDPPDPPTLNMNSYIINIIISIVIISVVSITIFSVTRYNKNKNAHIRDIK